MSTEDNNEEAESSIDRTAINTTNVPSPRIESTKPNELPTLDKTLNNICAPQFIEEEQKISNDNKIETTCNVGEEVGAPEIPNEDVPFHSASTKTYHSTASNEMNPPTTSRSNKNPDDDNDHTDVNIKSGATGSVDIGSIQPIVETTVEDVDHTGVGIETGATGLVDIGGSIPQTVQAIVQAIVQATVEGVDNIDVEPILDKINDIDGEIEAIAIDSVVQDTDPKSTTEENKNQNMGGSNMILRHDYDTNNVGIGKKILPTPSEGCNLVIPLGSINITLSKYSCLQIKNELTSKKTLKDQRVYLSVQ